MGSFGTQTNPSHYVEIPDPANPGQVKRPAAGTVLKARVYGTGAVLPDVTTTDYGYFSTSPSADVIEVSGDGGVTWVGPLVSAQASVASTTAGADAAAATLTAGQALDVANTALSTAQNGPAPDWTNIQNKPTTFSPSPHTHTAGQVGLSALGLQIGTAANGPAVLGLIGAAPAAGLLQLGSTATTAAPGNHTHAAGTISYAPSGGLAATSVQGAIDELAVRPSGGGGTANGQAIYYNYRSGAWPTVPATPPWSGITTRYFIGGPSMPASPPAWTNVDDIWLSPNAG